MKLFFSWFAGVLSDPNDQQGSTQRVCLMLFLGTIMALVSLAAYRSPAGTLPVIPDSILNLIYYVVGVLTGGIAIGKGIAAAKAVKTGETSDRPTQDQPKQAEEPLPTQP